MTVSKLKMSTTLFIIKCDLQWMYTNTMIFSLFGNNGQIYVYEQKLRKNLKSVLWYLCLVLVSVTIGSRFFERILDRFLSEHRLRNTALQNCISKLTSYVDTHVCLASCSARQKGRAKIIRNILITVQGHQTFIAYAFET